MPLLHPMSFASAVASSKNSLDKIASIISDFLSESKKETFLFACKNLDFRTANQILDDLVQTLTELSPVSVALNEFADKFPQLPTEFGERVHSALSEEDKVKAIDRSYKRIVNIIEDSFNDE